MQGTVYTLAQLSAFYENASSKAQGSSGAKRDAAEEALKALGTVYILGRVSNGSVMGYETERGTSKYNGSCLFKGDHDFEDLDPVGKTVIVRARITGIGTGGFIELRDCEVVGNAGLKKSTILEDPDLDYGPAAVSAGVNKGIKPAQIDGVYLEQNTGFGVGGMMIIRYDPVLMLKDGWAYDGWMLTPADLDVKLSKKLEPKSWRRYERKGDQIRIQESDGQWSKFEKWSKVEPARPGDKLRGTFSSISGGGR